jgi:hypothetical protein
MQHALAGWGDNNRQLARRDLAWSSISRVQGAYVGEHQTKKTSSSKTLAGPSRPTAFRSVDAKSRRSERKRESRL